MGPIKFGPRSQGDKKKKVGSKNKKKGNPHQHHPKGKEPMESGTVEILTRKVRPGKLMGEKLKFLKFLSSG